MVAVFAVIDLVMMTARAMHVTVFEFFRGGRAHVDHRQVEAQRHAGQWMVAIQDDLVIGDFGDGKDHRLIVAVFGHAFELHADFNRFRQARTLLDLDQLWLVVAERIVRFDLDRRGIAGFFAVELFFDLRQGILIAAVQVHHRLGALLDQIVLGIRQFVVNRHDRVFSNLHRPSFHCELRIILPMGSCPCPAGYNGA